MAVLFARESGNSTTWREKGPFWPDFGWRKTVPRRTLRAFSPTDQGQVMLWMSKSVDNRQAISRADLVLAITDAVKQSDPDCAAFVDVIVQHIKPKSQLDPNWIIKGIRFGRSDRQKAAEAIGTIVARMQHEFRLSEETPSA